MPPTRSAGGQKNTGGGKLPDTPGMERLVQVSVSASDVDVNVVENDGGGGGGDSVDDDDDGCAGGRLREHGLRCIYEGTMRRC